MSNPFSHITSETESPDALIGMKDGHPIRVPVARRNASGVPSGGGVVEWADLVGSGVVLPSGEVRPLAAMSGSSLVVISRDASNRVTSYSLNNVVYVLTYGAGGRIESYTANGVLFNLTYGVDGLLTGGQS